MALLKKSFLFLFFVSTGALKSTIPTPLWISLDQGLPDFSNIKACLPEMSLPTYLEVTIEDLRGLCASIRIKYLPKGSDRSFGEAFAMRDSGDYSPIFRDLRGRNKLLNFFRIACECRGIFLMMPDSRLLFISSCIFMVLYKVLDKAFNDLYQQNSDNPFLKDLGWLKHQCYCFDYDTSHEYILDYKDLMFFPNFQDSKIMMDTEALGDRQKKLYIEGDPRGKKKELAIRIIFARIFARTNFSDEIRDQILALIVSYYGAPKDFRIFMERFFEAFFGTKFVLVTDKAK